MADGAGKIALGAGLMSFGQNLGQAITANERRKQSLEEIRQRFGQQMALLDRREEMLTAREDREYERGAPERNARLGLLSAQTDAARALAEDRRRVDPVSGDQIFGMGNPDNYTDESRAAAQRYLQENPQDRAGAYELLVRRSGGNDGGPFSANQIGSSALNDAASLIPFKDEAGYPIDDPVGEFISARPSMAQAAGIDPDMDPYKARRKLAEYAFKMQTEKQLPQGGGLMGNIDSGPIPVEQLDAPPPPGTRVIKDGQIMIFDGQQFIPEGN